MLLCHVNPYRGLALIDEPAAVTAQINNEKSAVKGTEEGEATVPYQKEVQEKK